MLGLQKLTGAAHLLPLALDCRGIFLFHAGGNDLNWIYCT